MRFQKKSEKRAFYCGQWLPRYVEVSLRHLLECGLEDEHKTRLEAWFEIRLMVWMKLEAKFESKLETRLAMKKVALKFVLAI